VSSCQIESTIAPTCQSHISQANIIMKSLAARLFGRKEPGEEDGNNSWFPSLQMTPLGQVFCQGCLELDERSTARLIWAPKVLLSAVRKEPAPVHLHRNFQELETSSRNGCHTCRFWVTLLMKECDTDHTRASLMKSPNPVFGTPPVSTNRPWIITVSTKTATGELLQSIAALENTPPLSTPG
jgi:hypothetical protein